MRSEVIRALGFVVSALLIGAVILFVALREKEPVYQWGGPSNSYVVNNKTGEVQHYRSARIDQSSEKPASWQSDPIVGSSAQPSGTGKRLVWDK